MKRLRNGMAAWIIFAALSTALLWFVAGPRDAQGQSGGFTNFDSLVVNQDVLVGDDITAGGDFIITGNIISAGSSLRLSSNLTVIGNAAISGTAVISGNLSDSGGAFTIADNALIDGAADAVQLTVQGHSTQTANPNVFVVENSGGTDAFAVTHAGYVTVTQDLKVSDDLVVVDDATANDLFVSAWVRVVPRTGVVVTMNGIITPTGSYQPISSAGTVNTAQIAVGTAGDMLFLVNTSATTIVISDTSPLILTGNISLGQYDTLLLRSDGTRWIQLATSNN